MWQKYRLILNDSLHTMVKDVGISNGLGNQQTKHILYVASLPENLPEQNVNIQRDLHITEKNRRKNLLEILKHSHNLRLPERALSTV